MKSQDELDDTVRSGGYTITDDPMLVCRSEELDVIVEATGEIEFGANVTLEAINQ